MPPLFALPSTNLEPGDRFEIFLSSDGRTLGLPESFLDLDLAIEQLFDLHGQPLSFRPDDSLESLALGAPLKLPDKESRTLWLEYQGPGRFRLVLETEPTAEPAELAIDVQGRLTLSSEDPL